MTPDELGSHVLRLRAENPLRRLIVGLIGAPGAGKSTLADDLAARLGTESIVVPMDGFHLSNEVLDRHGTRASKGAPDTFDADGYAALLERIRSDDGPVYGPRFHREIEESIAAEIEIAPSHRVIVTEGNYLLIDDGPWSRVRPLLDLAVFVAVDDDVRIDRLIKRHIQFGKTPDEAREWALGSDQHNADLVTATAGRADATVEVPEAGSGQVASPSAGRSG